MASIVERFIGFTRRKVGSSLGIIVIAAMLVELISVIQYGQFRKIIRDEIELRTRVDLRTNSDIIQNTLKSAEATMQEHLWDIERNLDDPDSIFSVTGRLISSNPNVVGGCIAFIPDYFPSKGRYFEPYASKDGAAIRIEQIGSSEHDYTRNPDFINAVEHNTSFWSDPYQYERESIMSLTTYSYPLTDSNGKVVAVCGLDIDLSWLGDTRNARQYYPSAYGLMLTRNGELVAGPSDNHTRLSEVERVTKLINDSTTVRRTSSSGRTKMIDFRDGIEGRKATVYYCSMGRTPDWQIAQVCFEDEVFASLRRMRLRHMLLVLAGLLTLFFIIRQFAKNENKLNAANLEQARIGSELAVARNIQMEMVPKVYPPFPDRHDIDIFGSVTPAREVGGDLFDFFIREEKLYFCIGDVSGKGVPSAMVMSVIHSLFRIISRHVDRPGLIAKGLNNELSKGNETNMFITFFTGILDLPSGKLLYCNAGHDHPFIVSDTVYELPVTANLPLGAFEDTEFEEQECELKSGSTIFLYTDGITEAKDTGRKQFTKHRLAAALAKCIAQPGTCSELLVKAVDNEVRHFTEGAEQSDDMTMLAIRYLPEQRSDALRESISMRNDVDEVRRLGDFVKSVTARLSLDKKTASAIRLALEEVVVNVIDYAYPSGSEGKMTVEAASDGKDIMFTVKDSGKPFDPTAVAPADTTLEIEDRKVGGLGILLANGLMDSVRYERVGNENVLTLIKSYHENQHSGNRRKDSCNPFR